MVDKLDYALLSNRAYPRTPENTTQLDGSGWIEDQRHLPGNDSITGFSAGVYINGDDIVIAFTGTSGSIG